MLPSTNSLINIFLLLLSFQIESTLARKKHQDKWTSLPSASPPSPTTQANPKLLRLQSLDPYSFLQKNGYGLGIQNRESILSVPKLRYSSLTENSDLKKMISTFQTLHHLNVTGELDTPTLNKMTAPRCGMPDIIHEGNTLTSKLKVEKIEQINLNSSNSVRSPLAMSTRIKISKYFIFGCFLFFFFFFGGGVDFF